MFNNNCFIWVGNKQSDVDDCGDFFSKTISLYGGNDSNHISFKQIRTPNLASNAAQSEFIEKQIKNEMSLNHNTKFMFYNQCRAYSFDDEIINNNFLVVNDKKVVYLFNNKIEFRKLFNLSSFHFPKYVVLKGSQINDKALSSYFKDTELFVLQQPYGAGCDNTLLLRKDELLLETKSETTYLISEFIENTISFNRHILISEKDIIIFQPSIQIIDLKRQSYQGADFINANEILGNEILKSSYFAAKEIAHKMQLFGYRGICGVDFMCDRKNTLYAIEINARFQASSFLINMSLKDNGLPSLQELNYFSWFSKEFFNLETIKKCETLVINYSSIILTNEDFFNVKRINNGYLYKIKTDAVEQYEEYDNKTYLLKLIYKRY